MRAESLNPEFQTHPSSCWGASRLTSRSVHSPWGEISNSGSGCLVRCCRIEGFCGKRQKRANVSNPLLPAGRFVPSPQESTHCSWRYEFGILRLLACSQRNLPASRNMPLFRLLIAACYPVAVPSGGLPFPGHEWLLLGVHRSCGPTQFARASIMGLFTPKRTKAPKSALLASERHRPRISYEPAHGFSQAPLLAY